jgi:hypothetical protein
VVRARALAGLGRVDEAAARLSAFLPEAATFPDPAVHLRVAVALLALVDDGRAEDAAAHAAASIEAALPVTDRPRFREAVDSLLAGRVAAGRA